MKFLTQLPRRISIPGSQHAKSFLCRLHLVRRSMLFGSMHSCPTDVARRLTAKSKDADPSHDASLPPIAQDAHTGDMGVESDVS